MALGNGTSQGRGNRPDRAARFRYPAPGRLAPNLRVAADLARLQHFWHHEREPGKSYPPEGSVWWRDRSREPFGTIVRDCEAGIDPERDFAEPFARLDATLTDWALKNLRVRDDAQAARFALEMLRGRPARDGSGYVSGYFQHPEWTPTPATWRLRIRDYDPPVAISLDETRDRDDDRPRLEVADPGVDVAEEAVAAVVRESWERLRLATIRRLGDRERAARDLRRWGAASETDVPDPVPGWTLPQERDVPAAGRQRRKRARDAFWSALGPAGGFDTTAAFVLRLLDDPENAGVWALERAKFGAEQWDEVVSELRTSSRPQNRLRLFLAWVVLRAIAHAQDVPTP